MPTLVRPTPPLPCFGLDSSPDSMNSSRSSTFPGSTPSGAIPAGTRSSALYRGSKVKKTIAILTGGGDVPGLNPAIRAITVRALRDGHRVLGIRKGWAGLVDYVPDAKVDNSDHV